MTMNRRSFLLGAAAPVLSRAQTGRTPERPPNILLILFDKCRTDAIGAYGRKDVHTPNLDWLAAGGVRFNNCYTPQALCGPARASILTGLYPHSHGLRKNVYPAVLGRSNTVYQEPISNPFHDPRFRLWDNFAFLLHNAGYETGHIGKWHLGPGNPGFFDTWKSFNSQLAHWVGKPHESPYRPDVHTAQAVEFIGQNARQPFFLYQSYYSPHEPLDPPKEFLARYPNVENAGYYASVANLDWNVGRMLDALRKHQILDRTLVIVTADHSRTWKDRPGSAEGMCVPYDDSSAIPLILRHPGLLPEGRVWQSGVSLVDLAPTILDAAGVARYSLEMARLIGSHRPPEQGHSLLAEVRSGRDAWSRPVVLQNISQAAYLGSNFEDRAIRKGRWKLALRKFDVFPSRRFNELFDMETDPEEGANLYHRPESRAVTTELAGVLRKWGEQFGDPLSVELAQRAVAELSQTPARE